ncbi:MAG: PriCT-2 domain-containing protein [Betaproteobacteria bacterium]|nr:PriCT-2 domain-containing protein [Betaproteobacteria bacterium]
MQGRLELFEAWSRPAESFDEKSLRATWQSIKAGGEVGIGSLFHLAQRHGFNEPKKRAEPATPRQLKARAEERKAAAAREAADREQRQREAATEAARLWREASEAGEAPYLQRKGCRPYGALRRRRRAAGAAARCGRRAVERADHQARQAGRWWAGQAVLEGRAQVRVDALVRAGN